MWELGYDIREITSDNASDMRSGIYRLCRDLHRWYPGLYNTVEDFYVRFIAHVLNLGVNECMEVVNDKIAKVRSVLNSIRPSAKRRELYDDDRIELGGKVQMRRLDCETRWTSTFTMARKAYESRSVINYVINSIDDLVDQKISESEWNTAKKVSKFLESAALVTENKSGETYVTLSLSVKSF